MNTIAARVRRRPTLAFGLGLGLALAAFYSDPLLLARSFSNRDLLPFFLPIEKAVHAAWRAGRVPLLLPEISFGRLLAANPNTGAFYPLRIAMALIPFSLAFKLFPILHLWLAGVGVFRLARRRGCSAGGSTLAGLVLAFCGPAVCEIAFPDFLPGLAWMPWLITAAIDIRHRPSAGRAAPLGAIWLVMLLAGDVVTCGLGLLGCALAFAEGDGDETKRAIVWLAAGLLAGTLAASIQIVPAILYAPLTVRSLGRFTLADTYFWSVHPWRMLELGVPFFFGNVVDEGRVWGEKLWYGKTSGFFATLYMGAFPVVAWAVARPRRRLFLHGFALVCLGGAIAGALLPGRVLAWSSPVPLRYPEKLMAGFMVASAVAAAHAFDRLDGRRGVLAAGLVALCLACAALFVRHRPEAVVKFVASHWSSAGGATAAADLPARLAMAAVFWSLCAGALFLRRPGRRWATALLVGFVALDLGSTDRGLVETVPESWIMKPSPQARVLRAQDRGEMYGYLPIWDRVRFPSPATVSGHTEPVDDVRAYLFGYIGAAWSLAYTFNIDFDGSDLYRVELARREATREGGADAGVGHYLAAFSARSTLLGPGARWHVFPTEKRRIGPVAVFENPDALARIRLAGSVREVAGVEESYALIHGRRVDLLETSVVETGRSGEEEFSAGRLRVRRYSSDDLEIETETPGPAMLVLPLSPHGFREIEIDGRAASGVPADLCLTAVPVPAGTHRVRVTERLPGGKSALAFSLAGATLLFLMAMWRGV